MALDEIEPALEAQARYCEFAARSRRFELFPWGYPAQTCMVAGMRRPRAWSTG